MSFAKLAPMMGMIFLINKLDMEDPDTQFYIRTAYVTSLCIQAVVLLLVRMKVNALESDGDVLHIPAKKAPFGDTEIEPAKDMTMKAYDSAQVGEAIKQSAIGIGMISFMHYKWEMFQPLVFQSMMPLVTLYGNPLVQVYLFGKAAEGPLARPWKAPSPFEGLMPQTPDTAPAVEAPPTTTSTAAPVTQKKEAKPAVTKATQDKVDVNKLD